MSKTIQIPFEAAEDRGTVLPLTIPGSCKLLEFVPQEPPALVLRGFFA